MDKIYIALDSDIVRTLTILEPYAKLKNLPVLPKNPTIQKYGPILCKLLNKSQADVLRLLVTSTVYHEVKHIPEVVDFIERNCYFPNSENLEDEIYINNIRNLAYTYCGINDNNSSKFRRYPFDVRYVAEFNRYCPCNDSYIMAEATVENAILLTANQKDFIFLKSYDNNNNNIIAKEIMEINKRLGYDTDNGFVSFPLGIKELEYFLSTGIKNLKNQTSNIKYKE